jgi:tetratricopeptide (TPR) repeat protein
MNRRILILFSLFALGASLAQAQAAVPSSSFADPQATEKANAHEDELYNDGTEALNNGDYDDAAGKFDQVVKLHGRKADAALYWKAYALNKAGNKGQALTTIAEFRKAYPKSTYQHQADVLEQEMRVSAGQTPNPDNISDEELKLLALQALMNSDPEKAVPLLDKVIHGSYSPKMKEKALFVLSQSNSDKAQQILLSLAKANNDPDLQKRAIRYIGMNGNSRNRAILKEIYISSSDLSVKKAVFQGWLMSGDKDDVLAVAQQEKSPELRKEAIRYLGMMGGRTELRGLYKQTADLETKEALLQAMGIGGDVQGMTEIAQSDKDPEIRRRAIRNLGIFGGHEATDTLISIYSAQTDLEVKKEVINALFLKGAGKQMVALARKETNPELKKALIQKMSLMNSPDITEYMMELLNK